MGTVFEAPGLAAGPLHQVLRTWGWIPFFTLASPQRAAEGELKSVVIRLQEQSVVRLQRHAQLHQLLAAAHLLRGAIDATRAERAVIQSHKHTLAQSTLQHFDDALRLPGNEGDLDALELKGYQLLRLGEVDNAEVVFEDLERHARSLPASKDRNLRLARTLKCQAYIAKIRGKNGTGNGLLNNALSELGSYTPLTAQDLLDQAQIHELHACVRFQLGFPVLAPASQEDAKACYIRLSESVRLKGWLARIAAWLRWALERENVDDILYRAAEAGLARVSNLGPAKSC
jgi:hypothetical protein